ncbi:hypothetical protein O6V14_04685 [Sphingomonas faeni]|uniref:hypothetical protein n=1 Tax=Sphingomonas faeni TaxID=185950 RepID=UPI003356E4D9
MKGEKTPQMVDDVMVAIVSAMAKQRGLAPDRADVMKHAHLFADEREWAVAAIDAALATPATSA